MQLTDAEKQEIFDELIVLMQSKPMPFPNDKTLNIRQIAELAAAYVKKHINDESYRFTEVLEEYLVGTVLPKLGFEYYKEQVTETIPVFRKGKKAKILPTNIVLT